MKNSFPEMALTRQNNVLCVQPQWLKDAGESAKEAPKTDKAEV